MATTTSWVHPTDFNGSIAQGVANGGTYSGAALPATMGATGQTSLATSFVALYETVSTTTGDIVYGGTSGTPTRLPSGTNGYFLQSTGTSSAPQWSAVSITGSTVPTATTVSEWDSNVNMNANNFLPLSAITAASGGTLTLTAASKQVQVINGTANHTVQLPKYYHF